MYYMYTVPVYSEVQSIILERVIFPLCVHIGTYVRISIAVCIRVV